MVTGETGCCFWSSAMLDYHNNAQQFILQQEPIIPIVLLLNGDDSLRLFPAKQGIMLRFRRVDRVMNVNTCVEAGSVCFSKDKAFIVGEGSHPKLEES